MINEAVGDPRYLVFVDANSNKNKFYKAYMNADKTSYTVEYGRIGAPSYQTKVYQGDAYDMEDKVMSKIRKGYRDQTDLVKQAITTTSSDGDGYKSIENASVNELIKALRRYASDVIKQNYTIGSNAITQEMLDAAQKQIDELHELADDFSKTSWAARYGNGGYVSFNNALEKLFRTIPRKMNKVVNFILPSGLSDSQYTIEATKIIDREQKLYDILLADFQTKQANLNATPSTQQSTQKQPAQTILEHLGLECTLIEDPTTIKQIKDHMGSVASRFSKAFLVKNIKTQQKYESFQASMPNCQTKLFFHGSRNENFWNIIKNGLLLNPKAKITGKLLGNGIYFANKAAKSINYTSLRGSTWAGGTSTVGYMAVFAVAIDPKMAYDVWTHSDMSICHNMTWDKLQRLKSGSTHVFGHKASTSHPGSWLREDELCVYREDQCTIRYLIELK